MKQVESQASFTTHTHTPTYANFPPAWARYNLRGVMAEKKIA